MEVMGGGFLIHKVMGSLTAKIHKSLTEQDKIIKINSLKLSYLSGPVLPNLKSPQLRRRKLLKILNAGSVG